MRRCFFAESTHRKTSVCKSSLPLCTDEIKYPLLQAFRHQVLMTPIKRPITSIGLQIIVRVALFYYLQSKREMRKQDILCFSAAIQFGPTNIGKHVTHSGTVIRLSFPSCATHNRFPIDRPSILVGTMEKNNNNKTSCDHLSLAFCVSLPALWFSCACMRWWRRCTSAHAAGDNNNLL